MKVLITGSGGQLGRELVKTAPGTWEVSALGKHDLDITRRDAVRGVLEILQPQIIINAAAYTAVDRAEDEESQAFDVNARGAENLAKGAEEISARLIHISTDFVFDGRKAHPYRPDDLPNPLGVYGKSKLEGERRVRLVTGGRGLIVRTSWLYGANGHNFMKTILTLIREKSELRVISDQVGSPTWARGLATALWAFAKRDELKGIYHWSDAGVATWYDFAVAIQEEAHALDLVTHPIPIYPIGTEDYPQKASRPAYSVLDSSDTWQTLEIAPQHWRVALRKCLKEMARVTETQT